MHRKIKILIWVYLALLILEGAMRKWWLQSFSDYLLVVRDPVLLLIYAVALVEGVFPLNLFTAVIGVLAGASVFGSLLTGQSNLVVIAYGVRINYLHLPLMWVMGRVLNRRDVERLGAFLLLIAIPMTLVMVAQFRAPMNSWINRGVGNDEGGQIFGADGRIRPPGLFAFITGPQLFFPLCAAFFFDHLCGAKRLPWYLLIACGIALAVALPVSISRTVMIGTGIVAIVFLVSLPFTSSRFSSLSRPILLLGVLFAAISQLPIFQQGLSVFMMRWDQAANESEGEIWVSLADRVLRAFTSLTYYIEQAPIFGYGVGVGSNVGSRLINGTMGFNLAEDEWGKILLELGPPLGIAFIVFRLWLTGYLGLESWRALRYDRNPLPILIWSATMAALAQGQWAPPTVLGFAVIGGGLTLGALNPVTQTAAARAPVATAPLILAQSTHAPLPVPSDRRPPVVIRTVQK